MGLEECLNTLLILICPITTYFMRRNMFHCDNTSLNEVLEVKKSNVDLSGALTARPFPVLFKLDCTFVILKYDSFQIIPLSLQEVFTKYRTFPRVVATCNEFLSVELVKFNFCFVDVVISPSCPSVITPPV